MLRIHLKCNCDVTTQLHTELVRKELEVDGMQHNLTIARNDLSKKRKVGYFSENGTSITFHFYSQLTEEAMKRELAEKQALEKSLRALEQRREAHSSAGDDYLLVKRK